MSLLEVSALHHQFGRQRVLNGLDLRVHAGECAVLYGANGSGKSTLLSLLATRLRLQKGRYRLNDWDPLSNGESIRGSLVYIGHHSHLYGHLTPVENLLFFCDLRCLRVPEVTLRQAIDEVGLSRFADQPTRWFSAGMKKRLTLARMLLAKPSLLLLDEPYSALDQNGISWLNDVLTGYLHNGGIIVMASHDPDRVAPLKHQPYRINNGILHMINGSQPC